MCVNVRIGFIVVDQTVVRDCRRIVGESNDSEYIPSDPMELCKYATCLLNFPVS